MSGAYGHGRTGVASVQEPGMSGRLRSWPAGLGLRVSDPPRYLRAMGWGTQPMGAMSDSGSDGPVEHAVIARYRLTGGGFGLDTERAAIRRARHSLAEAIEQAGVGEFDGNEFGRGAVVLYAYGPDADALFAVMGDTLR